MISLNYLLDILKYTIAGIGVVWVAFYLVRPYLEKSERIQMLEIKKAISSQTLPLRLQAYERMILFIERINPANMLIRLNAPQYNVQELHSVLVQEIRSEYQHNITQQIYVSADAWATVKKVKDDTLTLVNGLIMNLPPDATALDVSKILLSHLGKLEEDPYEAAANVVKRDLENIF